MQLCWKSAAAAAIALATVVIAAAPVLAHDVHTFGKVTVALGWVNEPAYAGVPNSVQVIVKDAAGNPITTITDKDVTVSVTAGGKTLADQPLTPSADPDTGLGLAGEYRFAFIPTAPGTYTFHVKGTVAGQAIDDNVTSSDKTFDDVTDPPGAQFPVQVPSAADMNTHIDRADARAQAARAAADSAKSAANTALIFGVAALVVAILLSGLTFFVVRRRPS